MYIIIVDKRSRTRPDSLQSREVMSSIGGRGKGKGIAVNGRTCLSAATI